MALKIEMEVDNAAFDECPNDEIGRILRKLATDIENGDMDICRASTKWTRPLVDANGNTVGKARFV